MDIRKQIEDWQGYNSHVKLDVLSVSSPPEYQISFAIGDNAIPFQVFTNEKWEPMV